MRAKKKNCLTTFFYIISGFIWFFLLSYLIKIPHIFSIKSIPTSWCKIVYNLFEILEPSETPLYAYKMLSGTHCFISCGFIVRTVNYMLFFYETNDILNDALRQNNIRPNVFYNTYSSPYSSYSRSWANFGRGVLGRLKI